ncbi:uncharacterized protein LOC125945566 [Dermacentor silvarum]|uniref:uncharacterized protein LOC125945566 n=1 Tax=Dermacentor silvarum TaxID=543639 RepID=UPI002100AE72|nr:uncharacterized protein LOC125945566 [Dermacentor silvarum]
METVPLADQSCHRAGILTNVAGGGVCLSRCPPSVTIVVQSLPNTNDPVVLAPPCQAPATSTAEEGRPLHSQRSPNTFLPYVNSHPLVLPQLLSLHVPRSKVSHCRHDTTVVLPFLVSTLALNLLPLLACALLRYHKIGFPRVSASQPTNRGRDCVVSAGLSTEEQSTTRRAGITTGCQLKTTVTLSLSNCGDDVGQTVVVPNPRDVRSSTDSDLVDRVRLLA